MFKLSATIFRAIFSCLGQSSGSWLEQGGELNACSVISSKTYFLESCFLRRARNRRGSLHSNCAAGISSARSTGRLAAQAERIAEGVTCIHLG